MFIFVCINYRKTIPNCTSHNGASCCVVKTVDSVTVFNLRTTWMCTCSITFVREVIWPYYNLTYLYSHRLTINALIICKHSLIRYWLSLFVNLRLWAFNGVQINLDVNRDHCEEICDKNSFTLWQLLRNFTSFTLTQSRWSNTCVYDVCHIHAQILFPLKTIINSSKYIDY